MYFVAIFRYSLKPRVLSLHHPGYLSNSAQTNASTESNIRITGSFKEKVQISTFYPIQAFT